MIDENPQPIAPAILIARYGDFEFRQNFKWLSKSDISHIMGKPIYVINRVLASYEIGLPLPTN